MARKAREKSETGFYAVLLRGEQENIFKLKKNRELFSSLANDSFGGTVHNIKFKNDSVTLVVEESGRGLGIDMKPVLISFARAYNKENGITGKVFKDRFKSTPLDTPPEDVDFANVDYISAPKPARKPKPAKEPETQKPEPKKKNDMPTWLL